MIRLFFALFAMAFLAYAGINMWRRPGFLASALVGTYGLAYFLDQNEVMQFRELAGSDPSAWSYPSAT